MRKRALAWVSLLLLLFGVLLPGAAWAAGGDPRLLVSLLADEQLCDTIREVEVVPGILFSTVQNAHNMAPGDSDPPGTCYRYVYPGSEPARLYLSTQLEGELGQCDNGQSFYVEIVESGTQKRFDPDLEGQLVKTVSSSDPIATFAIRRGLLPTASNDCQGKSASFGLQILAQPIELPPPAPVLGQVVVRVLDNSPRHNGTPVPLANATVRLSNGQTLITDQEGLVTFSNLSLGAYTVFAEATDPQNPGSASLRSVSADALLTLAEPIAEINVVLAWEPPLAPPEPSNPPPSDPIRPEPRGSVVVRVLDASLPDPVPIVDAEVLLEPARKGHTGSTGDAKFVDLPFGTYTATIAVRDPRDPDFGPFRRATGTVEITRINPDEQITFMLAWELPRTAPEPTVTQNGPVGEIAGRICAPAAPGARLVATGTKGVQAEVYVPADGTLGVWKPYVLENLAPGEWVLTYYGPNQQVASQTVTVSDGQTASARDFTLACTGDDTPLASVHHPSWPYVVGGLLLISGGMMLRRTRKMAA